MMPAHARGAPGYGAALLVAALFFAAIAPTLTWLEFVNGSENLVVAAVTEMERGGPALVPNLQGKPRIKKPPLPTWIAASGVRDATVRDLSSPNRATRDAAFKRLAFEVRWTSFLAACLLLVTVYALGRLAGNARAGLVAALIAGSTILFLRFGRTATTDVHLALWVTIANVCFAAAAFRGRRWLGAIGGGAALGLAFMCKGPVALVQSVAPFALFVAWRAWDRRKTIPFTGNESPATPPQDVRRIAAMARALLPILAGLLAFLVIALPWYVVVVARVPGAMEEWFSEVSRDGATDLPPDPWYVYFVLFLYVAPWVAWFIAGTVMALKQMLSSPAPLDPPDVPPAARDGIVLTFLLTFVPVIVMMFFKDKNERYLFPLVAPAALLVAQALVGWVEVGCPRNGGAITVRIAQWLTLGLIAVGVPVLAACLKTIDGGSWISPMTAALSSAAGALMVLTGLMLERRRPYAMVAAAVALMLLVQYPFLAGYRNDRQGRAELKPLADAILAAAPDADVYELDVENRTRTFYDLPIYLNRVTAKTSNPSEFVQGPRPVALVYFGSRKAPEPALSAPWRVVTEGREGKSIWRLYLLPAK